jgi:group II intron reverse transcriptase/maturase
VPEAGLKGARKLGNLKTPDKVQCLVTALNVKAKSDFNFRFYSLYDKVCRPDVLEAAYLAAKENKGSPGVDGETFESIEESIGRVEWLESLAKDLRDKTYRTGAVRRVWIPKANGKLRPLGIPNIRDRVAQTAVNMVLEPIFEADLCEEQYAYRKGRKAQEAVGEVQRLLNQERRLEVIDGDLSGYFDEIPHPELMKSLERRVADHSVLRLIKGWLEAPVMDRNEKTKQVVKSYENKEKQRGTPQGSPLSPLLSSIYMRRFIVSWKKLGFEGRFGGKIVNFADDFVICCKRDGEGAIEAMRYIMGKIGLTVNEEKTRLVKMPEGKFVFLGYEFCTLYSWKTKKKYIGTRPAQKSIKRMMESIHEKTAANMGCLDASIVVQRLNWAIRGWANYFNVGTVTKVFQNLSRYCAGRFRHWLGRKHKWRTKRYKQLSDDKLYEEYKLIDFKVLIPTYSSAKA